MGGASPSAQSPNPTEQIQEQDGFNQSHIGVMLLP